LETDERQFADTRPLDPLDLAIEMDAESVPPEKVERAPRGLFERIGLHLFRPETLLRDRLSALDEAVAQRPDVAANYLARGDVLLQLGQRQDAATDYRHALELAAAQVDNRRWGLTAQVIQDRAYAGLAAALNARRL
jgi:hypothetical protein